MAIIASASKKDIAAVAPIARYTAKNVMNNKKE